MSNAQLISYADLTGITGALRDMATATSRIGGQIDLVQQEQATTLSKLEGLISAFLEFYKEDKKAKALQLAETRVVKVRQELETKFGYYAEVRRLATGILQGVDHDLIAVDTVRFATEELMIKAPGYWLAPALVALSAWLRDDRPTAARALAEALRRDDFKVSLYFALVSKRISRLSAAATWIERYFQHLDFKALDREFVVLVDAIASGVLGPEARLRTLKTATAWLDDLAAAARFQEDQEKRWSTALGAFVPTEPIESYPNLRRYCGTWSSLESSLRDARCHQRTYDHFHKLFDGPIPVSPRLHEEVDAILSRLVTHFDDEELPLRSQERLLQFIIEAEGDRELAEQRFKAEEKAFDEKVDFAQFLTNAALAPEVAKSSVATQRLAISLSLSWLVAAYDSNTAKARMGVPESAEISIDEWTCAPKDGTEEGLLLESQSAEYEKRIATALASAKLPAAVYVLPLVAACIVYFSLPAGVILLLASAVYGAIEWNRNRNRLKAIQSDFRDRHEKAAAILKATLAEFVDYRSEWRNEDQKAERTREFLLSISPEQHVRSHASSSRSVIQNGG